VEFNEARAHLEAVLFANADPLTATHLADILEIEEELAERLLLQLRDECDADGRGIQLLRLESGWQLATKQSSAEYVKKALDRRRNVPLTQAALEVLAIIAYNQPVSRSFIEHVRGTDSSSVVATLIEKELIAEAGRLDLPGRPIAFKTTDAFLRAFDITSLGELPALHTEAPKDGSEGKSEDEDGSDAG
jgi:segregation and condensation protein B